MGKGEFLGEFEIYILLAARTLGEQAYGVTIRRHIEQRTGRDVAMGAVYATLGRLTDKSLMQHALSDPDPVPGGRARKLYRITAAGNRALAHSTTMLTRMMDGTAEPARRKAQ